jgi:hypothetical protein
MNMSKNVNLLFLITCIGYLVVVMTFTVLGSDPHVTKPDKISMSSFEPIQSGLDKSTHLSVKSFVYPSEFHFGDTLYLQITRENKTDVPIEISDYDAPVSDNGRFMEGIKFALSFGDSSKEWNNFVPDEADDPYRFKDIFIDQLSIKPGNKLDSIYSLELPIVMNKQFWQNIQDKDKCQDSTCTLKIKIPVRYFAKKLREDIDAQNYITLQHSLLVKPRQMNERELLSDWYKKSVKSPKLTVFSKIDGLTVMSTRQTELLLTLVHTKDVNGKFTDLANHHVYNIKNNYESITDTLRYDGDYLVVKGRKYPPWFFTRIGSRTPPMYDCPSTIKGWKELEESINASTLRDEVRFTRMLIEYFDATDKQQVEKCDELINWLKSLPEPQRMHLASRTDINHMGTLRGIPLFCGSGGSYGNFPDDFVTPLLKLAEELQPMMSHYHKKAMKQIQKIQKRSIAND